MTKDDWDGIVESWAEGRDRLWRAHSDAINIALCRRWLSDRPSRRLLKTDPFDEAAGVGLWTAIMHAPRVLMVPLARLLDRMVADRDVKERYVGAIERFEAAERWPTRFVTGHFIALLAKKT